MTDLDHTDRLLRAKPGTFIVATEPVHVGWAEGGEILIPTGGRVRVEGACGWSLTCVTEVGAKTVWVSREELLCFDMAPTMQNARPA